MPACSETKKIASPGLRAVAAASSRALVVGQKLRNRPLGLLGQHEIRHARKAERLPSLDGLVEEAARLVRRAWRDNCPHDAPGRHRLREHRKARVAEDLA